MKDLKSFHEIEIKNNLFDLHSEDVSQLWDVLRVAVYNTFYCVNPGNRISSSTSLIKLIKNSIRNLQALHSLGREKNLFFIYSRDIDKDGYWFDKISNQVINTCAPNDRIVIELNSSSGRSKFAKFHLFIISVLLKVNVNKYAIPDKEYEIIDSSFEKITSRPLDRELMDMLYSTHVKYERVMTFVLKILRPRHIFVSCDCQKGIYAAAKKMNIPTSEMQHAGVVFDYPSYSYPSSITKDSNILFADSYLRLGDMWGSGINIPSTLVTIGNDYLVRLDKDVCGKDVTFISTLLHRNSLLPICLSFATRHNDMHVVYKLHPAEFSLYKATISYFENVPNVTVLKNDIPMVEILEHSQLVVLVYSSTFFEAISLCKKVAVLKVQNYSILNQYLNLDNVYQFCECTELDYIISRETLRTTQSFYESFRLGVAKELLN